MNFTTIHDDDNHHELTNYQLTAHSNSKTASINKSYYRKQAHARITSTQSINYTPRRHRDHLSQNQKKKKRNSS